MFEVGWHVRGLQVVHMPRRVYRAVWGHRGCCCADPAPPAPTWLTDTAPAHSARYSSGRASPAAYRRLLTELLEQLWEELLPASTPRLKPSLPLEVILESERRAPPISAVRGGSQGGRCSTTPKGC